MQIKEIHIITALKRSWQIYQKLRLIISTNQEKLQQEKFHQSQTCQPNCGRPLQKLYKIIVFVWWGSKLKSYNINVTSWPFISVDSAPMHASNWFRIFNINMMINNHKYSTFSTVIWWIMHKYAFISFSQAYSQFTNKVLFNMGPTHLCIKCWNIFNSVLKQNIPATRLKLLPIKPVEEIAQSLKIALDGQNLIPQSF